MQTVFRISNRIGNRLLEVIERGRDRIRVGLCGYFDIHILNQLLNEHQAPELATVCLFVSSMKNSCIKIHGV